MHSDQAAPQSPQLPPASEQVDLGGDDDHEMPKGFRRRWLSRPSNACEIAIDPDEAMQPGLESSHVLGGLDADSGYEPSIGSTVEPTLQPRGSTCPRNQSEQAVAHMFLSSVRVTELKMPWEVGPFKGLFSSDDDSLDVSWSVPNSCPVIPSQSANVATSSSVTFPEVPTKALFTKAVKAMADHTFVVSRDKMRRSAVAKWIVVLGSDLQYSQLGSYGVDISEDYEGVIDAVLGTKSPNTVLGRANAFLSFMRWFTTSFPGQQFLPISERSVWSYLVHLKDTGAPPTKAATFVQALRFAHYVFGLQGCVESFSSRRVIGLSEILLSGKPVTKQARPLSVSEVRRLHEIASDVTVSLVDRVIASHCLLMIYGRCRHSDTVQVESVSHDHSGERGYVQVNTKYHKGNKTAAKKSLLLPILIPAAGVGGRPWAESWWEARTQAGLQTDGEIHGPLLPAPAGEKPGCWAQRPMTCSELSAMLKLLLEKEDDPLLTSHSLKTTTLSWCAKGEVGRDQRRLLGRHSSTLTEADSVYSRDLCYGPVKCLESVLQKIRDMTFLPDAPRTFFTPTSDPLRQVQANPVTASVLPQTSPPEVGRHAVSTPAPAPASPVCSIKSEWSMLPKHLGEVIEISTSSESDTSAGSEAASSSSDDAQLEPPSVRPRLEGFSAESQDDVLVQHQLTKTIHLAFDNSECSATTQCGRTIGPHLIRIHAISEWPLKCRVCFKGRRCP